MAAPVPSLVSSYTNRLTYLLTADGAGGTLTFANTGTGTGTTPDLAADASFGPLKEIFQAKVNGIGTLAAGTGVTQAQARDLLCGDGTSSCGNQNVPRALIHLGPTRSGSTVFTALDANQTSANPTITITASAVAGTAYLYIIAYGVDGY